MRISNLTKDITILLLILLSPFRANESFAEESLAPVVAQQFVVIPTLGEDHQKNLDYSVAHVMALLKKIQPDAVIVRDYTDWLDAGRAYNAMSPESHVALEYSRQYSVSLFGTRAKSESTYRSATDNVARMNEYFKDAETVANAYRPSLDSTAARVARDYSFTDTPKDLGTLIANVFPQERSNFELRVRQILSERCKETAQRIETLLAENSVKRRWVLLLTWPETAVLEETLNHVQGIELLPVTNFLPLTPEEIDDEMDLMHTAWILSGLLDEWYGMWAPQMFNGERIAGMLSRLKRLSPESPTSQFLQARWLMQNRDYGAAKTLLEDLVEKSADAKFPFPINGKWIRPPWSRIRDKASLNLAFVHDYQKDREKALKLYQELLDKGDHLNDEAQAIGYVFDDILSVITSYTERPWTGMPEEAFRHYRSIARRVDGAPFKEKSE